jgi:hypothetical protein
VRRRRSAPIGMRSAGRLFRRVDREQRYGALFLRKVRAWNCRHRGIGRPSFSRRFHPSYDDTPITGQRNESDQQGEHAGEDQDVQHQGRHRSGLQGVNPRLERVPGGRYKCVEPRSRARPGPCRPERSRGRINSCARRSGRFAAGDRPARLRRGDAEPRALPDKR